MNSVVSTFINSESIWGKFWRIYSVFERRAELQELVVWAKRKRLKGVERAYYTRLSDEERRLFQAYFHHPHLTRFAHALHVLKRLFAPNPRYYSGYAAKYRRSFLTGESKKTYSY
jgi:hypothetical protein